VPGADEFDSAGSGPSPRCRGHGRAHEPATPDLDSSEAHRSTQGLRWNGTRRDQAQGRSPAPDLHLRGRAAGI